MPSPKSIPSTIDYGAIALEVMFGGKLDLAKHCVAYRAGKTREDVIVAIQKARDPKNGHAKTELELSMLEVYLKSILKAAPAQAVSMAA